MELTINENKIRKTIREALDWKFAGALKHYLTDGNYLEDRMEELFDEWGIKDFPDYCEENGIELPDDEIERFRNNDFELIDELIDGEYSDYNEDYYYWKIRNGAPAPAREELKYEANPTGNTWLIHFSDRAREIWQNGFRYATADMSHLSRTGHGRTDNKASEGFDFAYPVDYGFDQMFGIVGSNYGTDAVLFQANSVIVDHEGDNEWQAIFYNNDAKNLIYLHYNNDTHSRYYDCWCVMSNEEKPRPIYCNENLEIVVNWAVANFRQYQRLMLNPRESTYKRKAMENSQYNRIIKEVLDKYFGQSLKKYLKNNNEKSSNLDLIDYNGNYYKLPRFLDERDWSEYLSEEQYNEIFELFNNDEEYEIVEKFWNGEYSDKLINDFAKWLEKQSNGYFPTSKIMDYTSTLPGNTWLIHFSDNADDIWRNGFQYGTANFEDLGYSGAGQTQNKDSEGIGFAFVAGRKNNYYDYYGRSPKYGKKVILFQANAVVAYHYGDEEEQAMFYINDARNLILIEETDDALWGIVGWNGQTLYGSDDLDEVVDWAIANFPQYRKQMLNPREYKNKRLSMRKSSYGGI